MNINQDDYHTFKKKDDNGDSFENDSATVDMIGRIPGG
jgi:hypothetical protein